MNTENQYRLVNKFFSCSNCKKAQKSLVKPEQNSSTCKFCNSETLEISTSEFNKENVDKTYRLVLNQNENNNTNVYHPRTDLFDRNVNNIYGEPQGNIVKIDGKNIPTNKSHVFQSENNSRINSNQIPMQVQNSQNQNLQANRRSSLNQNYPNQMNINSNPQPSQDYFSTNPNLERNTRLNNLQNLVFFPFVRTISPFNGNVNHHQDQNDDTHMIYFMDYFAIPSAQFFNDNYASNFNSNFRDPLLRIIFISSINFGEGNINHAASNESLKNLKRFKMNKEHAKIKKGGELEFPSCSICLLEEKEEEECILVPCGHIFHNKCVSKWFEINCKCPLCRYDLEKNSGNNIDLNNNNVNFQENENNVPNQNRDLDQNIINQNMNNEENVNSQLNDNQEKNEEMNPNNSIDLTTKKTEESENNISHEYEN